MTKTTKQKIRKENIVTFNNILLQAGTNKGARDNHSFNAEIHESQIVLKISFDNSQD